MGDFDETVRRVLDDDRIRAVERRILPGHDDHAIGFAAAWHTHVLELERATTAGDEHPWTAHDFLAALTVRDHLQSALRLLPVTLREHMAELTGPVDDRYRACTVADTAKVVPIAAGFDIGDRGWWWFRVPDGGEIGATLAALANRTDPAPDEPSHDPATTAAPVRRRWITSLLRPGR